MPTYGYIRTSRDQEPGHPGSDPHVQRRQLVEAGVDPARIYADVAASGAKDYNSRDQWHVLAWRPTWPARSGRTSAAAPGGPAARDGRGTGPAAASHRRAARCNQAGCGARDARGGGSPEVWGAQVHAPQHPRPDGVRLVRATGQAPEGCLGVRSPGNGGAGTRGTDDSSSLRRRYGRGYRGTLTLPRGPGPWPTPPAGTATAAPTSALTAARAPRASWPAPSTPTSAAGQRNFRQDLGHFHSAQDPLPATHPVNSACLGSPGTSVTRCNDDIGRLI